MRTDISNKPARWALAVMAIGLALSAVACGSDEGTQGGGSTSSPPTSSVTPTSSPVQCDDVAALRDSVQTLTTVTVQRGMAEELKADLADVQAKLTTLADDLRAQFQERTAALESALGELGTAVEAFAANPGSDTTPAVTSALREVSTAWTDLLQALSTRCPELSASATVSPTTS